LKNIEQVFNLFYDRKTKEIWEHLTHNESETVELIGLDEIEWD